MATYWREAAECFEKVSRTTKRREITKTLAEYLKSTLESEDLVRSLYLSIARVSSESNGEEMNIGEHILLKSISEFSHKSIKELKNKMKETGDISALVQIRSAPRLGFIVKNDLKLSEVFSSLEEIVKITGKDSSKKKIEIVLKLLTRCKTEPEAKYILRILDGKMKIGLSIQTVLCSLGLALIGRSGASTGLEKSGGIKSGANGSGANDSGDNNTRGNINRSNINGDSASGDSTSGSINYENNTSATNTGSTNNTTTSTPANDKWTEEENFAMQTIKEAYSQLPSFSRIVEKVRKDGLDGVLDSLISPGYPMRPMLSIAEKNPESVLERFKDVPFLVEYKYDGERVQVHCRGGKVYLFSRGLENTTERFSALEKPVGTFCRDPESDFIVDGEVVAYDKKEKKILPFQVLSNRKRKNTAENADRAESDVALFIFDILYLDRPLNKLPIGDRKKILEEKFQEVPEEVYVEKGALFEGQDVDKLNSIFSQAVSFGCEGVMVKSADASSTYEPAKRSSKWVKLKSDYVEGLHDTLDLIVIGGYVGKGKRTGVHGGFLLGSLGESGEIQSVSKIGTGFSESVLDDLYKEMQGYVTPEPVMQIDTALVPDMWFTPKVIWEVAAAGISLSNKHTAAQNSPEIPDGKGLSLRFPRFIRKREDKDLETSTHSADILRLFLQQNGIR